jgi:arsenate reductase
MTDRVYNVLFLCTRNSTRSILAEAILNAEGKGRFRAFSAGSNFTGQLHPMTTATLDGLGYPSAGLRSKSWDEFAAPAAPHMDFIFTVCDDAAGETCPAWAGHPITAHWGIEDPTLVEGQDYEKLQAFSRAARFLKNRITAFISLPIASIDRLALESELHEIGQMEDAAQPSSNAA